MIEALRQSWALFADAWLCALALALLLPQLGLVLVLRQQLFVGAAIGQASALGFAAALWLGLGGIGDDDHAHALPLLAGGLAAGAVAVLAMRALTTARSSLEARSVVVYLLGGSGAMLLLAEQPHGLHEVVRLQSSSLLGAGPGDVGIAAALALLTWVLRRAWQPRLLLWATDPALAQVLGLRLRSYDLGVGLWLGACVAFAIHATGLPFTFALLVLPVLIARESCRSLGAVVRWAPWLGVAGTAIALPVAQHPAVDWPPGQATVVLLCIAAVLARWCRERARGRTR